MTAGAAITTVTTCVVTTFATMTATPVNARRATNAKQGSSGLFVCLTGIFVIACGTGMLSDKRHARNLRCAKTKNRVCKWLKDSVCDVEIRQAELILMVWQPP